MSSKKDFMKKIQEIEQTSQIDLLRGLQTVEEMAEAQTKEEPPSETGQEIHSNAVPKQEVVPCDIPKGYELRAERKSERLQLRLPPSVLNKAKECAKQKDISINQWILEAIQEKK